MCFSLEWFKDSLIWLVIVCAVIGILYALVSFIIPKLGIGGEILAFLVKIFTIVFWAFVCIAVIVFCFTLISCLGPSLPRLR